ncbi:Heterokaryon incompatibility [Tolypocladium capitatum]|uniref:Heterokaryon incompatibility n=1 Tax=Tolypocladium capitatum TaxID=45235 RepID=A0A2K3QNJ8_9HYPO|nr:Heterokaryon incompatibility [Tolypocladium capitatum]
MKKISRMLSMRWWAADRGEPEPEARRRQPALTEAEVRHQLPSRGAAAAAAAAAGVRKGSLLRVKGTTGRIVADGSDDVDGGGDDDGDARPRCRPCVWCAAADFPRLLDWTPGEPRPWIPLSHVLAPPAAPCPFCAFFRALLGDDARGAVGGTFAPYLRIRRAFERLDGVGERHELAGAVLGEVMARNKTLPRGYVVRAEDDEDGAGAGAYCREGAPARIRGRTVTRMLDPVLPRSWIDFCRESHGETCGTREAPIQGLRLVDCAERRVVCVDDLDGVGDGLEYATLSYAWGARTTADPRPDPDGRLPDDLPPLFADAVSLVTALGLRYLWIDRLCALPLAAAERRRQADLMGETLARAALTLVVAAGEGVADGIPGVGAPRDDHQLSLQTRTGVFTTTLLRPDVEVAASAWARRAWTFQEGLLARRRLVLTPSQAYFQCRALHCHESVALPLRLAPGFSLGRVFPPAGAPRPAQLKERIGAFMARDVSRGEDRLDAFRGVLREYARIDALAVDHFLGLPLFHPGDFVNVAVVGRTDRLAVGLGWMPDRTPPSPPDPPEPCYALDAAAAFPSWTWLAWTLRAGHGAAGHVFGFNLVGEASPMVDGVRSPPRMDAYVGFADGSVLSWEADGEAIAGKADAVAFLRLRTYCFDVRVRRARPQAGSRALDDDAPLSRANRATVEAWIRAAPPPVDEHHGLTITAVLISGRSWGDAPPCAATALICHRRGWDPAAPLVRLGAVGIEFAAFDVQGDDGAVMRSVDTAAGEGGQGEERDLEVRLREVDLY